MADQADVEQALVAAVNTALYPQGSDAPSLPGPACHIHRGWPAPSVLDSALASTAITIGVMPVGGSVRLSTRFPEAWVAGATNAPTLHVTVASDAVEFSGTALPGQIAGILADGRAYACRTETNDTPELIAARLAALVRAHRPVQLAGPVLALPGANHLVARVVADQPAMRELRRQTQSFRIACFCPSPAMRDATAGAIDIALARHRFLHLADGSAARLLLAGGTSMDEAGAAKLFRRDLIYSAEYATTDHAMQATMLFGRLGLGADSYIN